VERRQNALDGISGEDSCPSLCAGCGEVVVGRIYVDGARLLRARSRFSFRASSVLAGVEADQELEDSWHDPQVTRPLERQDPKYSARSQPAGLRLSAGCFSFRALLGLVPARRALPFRPVALASAHCLAWSQPAGLCPFSRLL